MSTHEIVPKESGTAMPHWKGGHEQGLEDISVMKASHRMRIGGMRTHLESGRWQLEVVLRTRASQERSDGSETGGCSEG